MELTLRPQAMPTSRRSLPILAGLALLFMVGFFAFPTLHSRAEEPSTPAAPLADTEWTLFQRINEVRASYGLPPLELDSRLTDAAENHAWDMQGRRWGSHWGSDGSSYGQRIARTGYLAASKNEAIGWGYNTERMLKWWLNSPVHRPILLSSSLKQVGVGYADGNWWVLDFGTHQ